jgi:hypothetical protein
MKHEIDENELYCRLEKAVNTAISFARTMVKQTLPDSSMILLQPNCSYDGNPLEDDEEIFPDETLPENGRLGPLSLEETVKWLWRNGKIPEWINIRPYDVDKSFTYILLESCGRFTALEKHLYHKDEGYPPFHVTSPILPPGWESVEEDGYFNIEGKRKGWLTRLFQRSAKSRAR